MSERKERITTRFDGADSSNKSERKRQATQVDSDQNKRVRIPTQVDIENNGNFRQEGDFNYQTNSINQMRSASADAFVNFKDFVKAVQQLETVESSNGLIYTVKKAPYKEGGESVILLCDDEQGNEVVLKVFFRKLSDSSITAKARTLEYMKTEEGQKNTLYVYDTGTLQLNGSDYYYEVMPFCPQGDFSCKTAMEFDQLVKVISRLNEILNSIHKAGILHRDIKPENIYEVNGNIVLGDFGIARVNDLTVTEANPGSFGYRAPESLIALMKDGDDQPIYYFDEKSDYYSLGVTIGSLFVGNFVYEDLDAKDIMPAVRLGDIPLKRYDEHTTEIKNLINGLCRFDPNNRFGYEEVNKWLVDHRYSGDVRDEEWPRTLYLLNEEYKDEKSLFYGITKDKAHWDEGKNMLYRKHLENFFSSFRTDLARAAQNADEVWRTTDPDKGLFEFLKVLLPSGPIVWKGYTFNSLEELANRMVKTQMPEAYSEILQKRCLSYWLDHTVGIKKTDDVVLIVQEIEAFSDQNPEIACYWFGNSFAGKRNVRIYNQDISDLKSLIQVMFSDPYQFYYNDDFIKICDQDIGSEFYGFLYSFGYKDLCETIWQRIEKSYEETDQINLLINMMDMIATDSEDLNLIRGFFVKYGPVGISTYIKSLIDQSANPVYSALDSTGEDILNRIRNFQLPESKAVEDLLDDYLPLLQATADLQRVVLDNPFELETGAYDSAHMICTNLLGCFAFDFFGQKAPLGFSNLFK